MKASKAQKSQEITASPWQPILPQVLTPSMIAFEDDFLLIIDKPAGMLVHPTVSQWEGTLYDLVKDYYTYKGISGYSPRFSLGQKHLRTCDFRQGAHHPVLAEPSGGCEGVCGHRPRAYRRAAGTD